MMMILLKKLFKNWGVVQLAERVAVNHEVAGSSPAAPATYKKGEEMSTKEVKDLKDLKENVTKIRVRLNQLVDEFASIKNELTHFKSDVADDVKYLTERVDK